MKQANIELFREVMNHINQNRNIWNQTSFHTCANVHCFAGWAQVLSTKEQKYDELMRIRPTDKAQKALKISRNFALWLFDAERTINELHNASSGVINGTVDREGFNSNNLFLDGSHRYLDDAPLLPIL